MADGWLAASAITLGLFLFSLGRAGIAVAQHSMLARTFTTNLAFAFSVVVACTQLISGAYPNPNPNPNPNPKPNPTRYPNPNPDPNQARARGACLASSRSTTPAATPTTT